MVEYGSGEKTNKRKAGGIIMEKKKTNRVLYLIHFPLSKQYRVMKTVNVLNVSPGDYLSKDQAQNWINDGVTVHVQEKK